MNKGSLTALAREAGAEGVGTVCWMIPDVFGSIRVVETQAYYIPTALNYTCTVPNSTFKRTMPESCGAMHD
jgi:hypothetical protein